ncbi:MAG: hypothetical protein ACJ72N_27545 [Labedaea sp.]
MSQEIEDPFAQHTDEDDPFADADTARAGGGSFTPRPALEDLEGRLLAMIPRELDTESKTPDVWVQKGAPPTREQYTVDMVLLDGGPLDYTYKDKVTEGNTTTVTEKTFTVAVLPFLWTGVWRSEANLIGQLKKVDGTPKPILLGRLVKGPQAKDRKNGVSIQDVAAEFEKWRKNPRGAAPSFSWQVDTDVTPADQTLAREWWAAARANGFKLN